jgi:hypothetical protein
MSILYRSHSIYDAHVPERKPDKHVYITENTFYISVGPVAALGDSQLLSKENTFYIIDNTFYTNVFSVDT